VERAARGVSAGIDSVGVVPDALIAARLALGPRSEEAWSGVLNDLDGMHVRPSTWSRRSRRLGRDRSRRATWAGARAGRRQRLRIEGVPVGEELPGDVVPLPGEPNLPRGGSIIVVAATDAPLLPHQCDRLAQRAGLGVARTGGAGENSSGDLFLAFATGNRGLAGGRLTVPLEMLAGERIDPLFYAVIEATEEAIVNAMVAAETMTGRGGATAHRLDPDRLRGIMRRWRGDARGRGPATRPAGR
jgi:L-aminopeptidase/D-esterase-like protein